MWNHLIVGFSIIALSTHGVGCGGKGPRSAVPQAAGPPIGIQLLEKDPALKGKRFNGLLDFEIKGDVAFVATSPSPRVVTSQAHTGRRSLMLSPGTRRVTLKLSA